MEINSSLKKMIGAVLLPIIGVPLYSIGYDKMNDTFGVGDNSWAVTLYSTMFILVFALTPIALVYSVLKAK